MTCGLAAYYGGCSWIQKQVGIYLIAFDGNLIQQHNSTSQLSANFYNAPHTWSYENNTWTEESLGFGSYYGCNNCVCSWQGPISWAVAAGGGSGSSPLCNFSGSSIWPNSYGDPSVTCGTGYQSQYEYRGQYTVSYSGSYVGQYVVKTCSKSEYINTFSDTSVLLLPGPWPSDTFDNQDIVNVIYEGLENLREDDTGYYNIVLPIASEAIGYLSGGVDYSTTSLGATQFFPNPFSQITPNVTYTTNISSVHIVSISPQTLEVHVVSSVTVVNDLSSFEAVVSTPPSVADYDVYVSSGWNTLKQFGDDVVSVLREAFGFAGEDVWDGCFLFAWAGVPFGSDVLTTDKTFCLGEIPAWDSYILGLLRFAFLFCTLLACLWWVLE